MYRSARWMLPTIAFCCLVCLAQTTLAQSPKPTTPSDEPATITRTIDASQYFRAFPELMAYRNTSIQKAPAPVLAEVCEEQFGKARITRCWLNLDEMWDFRTREYAFNYPIGVHKYDGVPEKAVETWGSVVETRLRFDDDYLKPWGGHSDEVMLCIRRYERDILDKKLGVTMADWKMIFKTAVKHSKQVCPNIRYIEVCNEYACFIRCTDEEYYEFYRLAYQAVNEVNAELELAGDDRLLVGGPNVVSNAMVRLNRFFELYGQDASPEKKLDFITWHEYHDRYADIAQREKQVNAMLATHGLPQGLPMFITEHNPYHLKAGMRQYNLINAACLVKSLYFTSVQSPGVKILPWVVFHEGKIQTRFMWFAGPNEPDSKADELRMQPIGCSMRFLRMHKDWEITVDNDLDNNHIVLASVANDGLVVEAVNYGEPRDVNVKVDKLPAVFTVLGNEKVTVTEYLIDQKHSNCVDNPNHPGGIDKVAEQQVQPVDGTLTLSHKNLAKHGLVLWVVTPEKTGATLPAPSATE